MRSRRRPVLPLALVLVFLLTSAAAAIPAASAQEAAPAPTDHTIVSHDGTTLAATLYLATATPDDSRPAILTTHGWASDRSSRAEDARWLTGLGYHVLAYDSRGFGESGGMVGMNGPLEVADVTSLIDWWVDHAANSSAYSLQLDDARDPRIGMTGGSYGGAIQLLGAANDPRIDAIVPDITWHDLQESLAPNGVVKRGWVDLLFWGGTLGAHGLISGSPDAQGGLDPSLRDWYLEAMTTGRMPDAAREPLLERSPRHVIDDIHADTLLLQGWSDTLFDPDQAVANYRALAARDDARTHLVLHDGGHSGTIRPDTHAAVRTAVADFFAIHLDDASRTPPPAVRLVDPTNGGWNTIDPWGRTDAPGTAGHALTAPDGTTTITLMQGPAPTSHTEQQELSKTLDPRAVDTPLPTSVLLDTGITGPIVIAGRPTLQLNVTGDTADTTLFASLVTRDGAGNTHVTNGQVAAIRTAPNTGPDQVELPLVSVLHAIPTGHTLHVRLTTSDSAYHASRDPGQVTLHLDDAHLTLPTMRSTVATEPVAAPPPAPASDTQDSPGPGMLVPVIVALALVAYLDRRRPSVSASMRLASAGDKPN